MKIALFWLFLAQFESKVNHFIKSLGEPIQSQASGEDMHALYTPSRFQASVKSEECAGCQECVDLCSFGAIEMVKVHGSKKMKAQIKKEDCYGCGVCVVACKQKAIKFDLIRPKSHIPPAKDALLKGDPKLK